MIGSMQRIKTLRLPAAAPAVCAALPRCCRCRSIIPARRPQRLPTIASAAADGADGSSSSSSSSGGAPAGLAARLEGLDAKYRQLDDRLDALERALVRALAKRRRAAREGWPRARGAAAGGEPNRGGSGGGQRTSTTPPLSPSSAAAASHGEHSSGSGSSSSSSAAGRHSYGVDFGTGHIGGEEYDDGYSAGDDDDDDDGSGDNGGGDGGGDGTTKSSGRGRDHDDDDDDDDFGGSSGADDAGGGDIGSGVPPDEAAAAGVGGAMFDLGKLQSSVVETLNSGHLEAVKTLRETLMAHEWELHGRRLALRRGVANFEHYCALQRLPVPFDAVSALYDDPSCLAALPDDTTRLMARSMIEQAVDERYAAVYYECTLAARELASMNLASKIPIPVPGAGAVTGVAGVVRSILGRK